MTDFPDNLYALRIYNTLTDGQREELRKIVRNEDADTYQAQLQAASRRRAEQNGN